MVLLDVATRCSGLQHTGTFWGVMFLPGLRIGSLKGGRRCLLWVSCLEIKVQGAPALQVRDKMNAQQLHPEEMG